MSGLKTKRIIWTVAFLSVTLAAIVMECVAGLWHPAGTIPWTEYLARYVPWPLQLAAYVILAVWLPFHFWRHDHLRKAEYDRGYRDGVDHAAAIRIRAGADRAMLQRAMDAGPIDWSKAGPKPAAVRYVPGRSDGG